MNRDRFHKFALALAGWGLLLLPHAAHACAVCYGAPDAPMTKGMNAGIGVMLGVTAGVLAGFVVFIVCLVRRTRRFRMGQPLPN